MTQVASVPAARRFLGWRGRAVAVGLAMCLLAMLATAARLKPATAGLGTHQQLGLPPCSLRVLLGIRCPACGMTTSWSHFVRGQWIASIAVNPAGFILAVLASAVCVGATRVALAGCQVQTMHVNAIAIGLIGAMFVALINWVVRII